MGLYFCHTTAIAGQDLSQVLSQLLWRISHTNMREASRIRPLRKMAAAARVSPGKSTQRSKWKERHTPTHPQETGQLAKCECELLPENQDHSN
eukprot:6491186-Amphidinium_carterae.2